MAAVSLQTISKAYGLEMVLSPTSIKIEDGEFIVIVGASGCGKSTLLRLIAGLDEPTQGKILIDGIDVTDRSPAERDVAMVFQSYALYPHLTVGENIAFPLRMAGYDKRLIGAKVLEVATLLDVADVLDRKPRTLSGGQRQRVSIGRAIIREPAVLLLDEPLSNLDAGLRGRLRHEFARLHQRLGTTMIYVTHDQQEAMTLANRIVVMAEGHVEQIGAPLELYAHPATIAVAAVIGSPAINFFPVTIDSFDDQGARVCLSSGVTCPVAVSVPLAAGAPATLGMRPEALSPADDGEVCGTVELIERLGPLSFAHLGNSDGSAPIIVQLRHDQPVTMGDILRCKIAPEGIHLFGPDGMAYPPISP